MPHLNTYVMGPRKLGFPTLTARGSTQPQNSVVVWDRIVRSKKYAKINIAGGKQKYEFKEIGDSFRWVSPVNTLNEYRSVDNTFFLPVT